MATLPTQLLACCSAAAQQQACLIADHVSAEVVLQAEAGEVADAQQSLEEAATELQALVLQARLQGLAMPGSCAALWPNRPLLCAQMQPQACPCALVAMPAVVAVCIWVLWRPTLVHLLHM